MHTRQVAIYNVEGAHRIRWTPEEHMACKARKLEKTRETREKPWNNKTLVKAVINRS